MKVWILTEEDCCDEYCSNVTIIGVTADEVIANEWQQYKPSADNIETKIYEEEIDRFEVDKRSKFGKWLIKRRELQQEAKLQMLRAGNILNKRRAMNFGERE